MRDLARIVAAVVVLPVSLCAQASAPRAADAAAPAPFKAAISYADIQPLLDVLRQHLPRELAGKPSADVQAAWPGWVARRDADIRGRVARGDEDSLVNLWLFGTSFTDLPPARPPDVAAHGSGATLSQVADARLGDLFDALVSPGTNERLRFARAFLDGRGIDVSLSTGQERGRLLLRQLVQRMVAENADYSRALEGATASGDPFGDMTAYASLYRDRGLSSDTSILSSFAVEAALQGLKDSGMLGSRRIRRVAIVGPGLDVINKAGGYDFYPEQTIQPFTVVDSLIHLGLSVPGDVSVTTFDVSARVNQHLVAARDRARDGAAYVVQFPLSDAERWSQPLVGYWERVGGRIGEAVTPSRVPLVAGLVKVRALRVSPGVIMRVDPRDLNIVLERLEPLSEEDRFDLVVATNIFAYYGPFEQALAVMNVGRMLRPGGSLLSNQAVLPVAPMKPAVGHQTVVYSERQFDHMFWYQRQ